MKFKKVADQEAKRLNTRDDDLTIETREDGIPGLFIMAEGVSISRKKALKIAWAIIDELEPTVA